MKRLIIVLLSMMLGWEAYSQPGIVIDKFKEEPESAIDLNAIKRKFKDDGKLVEITNQNNELFALLKLKTFEKNIHFSAARGVEYRVFDAMTEGEVWLLISPMSRYINIMAGGFSKRFDFPLSTGLQPETVYSMEITIHREEIISGAGKLTIIPDIKNASVVFDGLVVENGINKMPTTAGITHEYEISAPLYHTVKDRVKIKEGADTTIYVTLNPAHGYMQIESIPESGADIWINGELQPYKTPYTTGKLASGNYSVRVVKDMYREVLQDIAINDGKTTSFKANMNPNFAEPTIITDQKSDIYMNGQYIGRGNWSGRLEEGEYNFESRKAQHRTQSITINLQNGNQETYRIPSPEPIYGTLSVQTDPTGASVYLNEEYAGKTPLDLNTVLIGDYTLKITKTGCKEIERKITIKEGQRTHLTEKMQTGVNISITGNSNYYSGSTVFIDGEKVGGIPYNSLIPYGKHSIIVSKGKKYYSTEVQLNSSDEDYALKVPYMKYRYETFILGNIAYSLMPQTSFGITIGGIRNWGWFISLMSGADFTGLNTTKKCDADGLVDSKMPFYTGKESRNRISVIGGAAIRVSDAVIIKTGVGYGLRYLNWETNDQQWIRNTGFSYNGLDMQLGLQFHIGSLALSVDAVTTNFKTLELKGGIGINIWNKKK